MLNHIPFRGAMNENITICDVIRRLGYSKDSQVKLYGEVFELVSDPIAVTRNLVFVDGIEKKSGTLRRIRIPLPLVFMANQAGRFKHQHSNYR